MENQTDVLSNSLISFPPHISSQYKGEWPIKVKLIVHDSSHIDDAEKRWMIHPGGWQKANRN